jgi:hypothetical protein
MQDLRLVAANERGSHLVLRSADGEKYVLSIDDRLRAAVRGDRSRVAQLDAEAEAHLPPRDIQARIRAGASAEQVARAAGVSVDRVRRFEGPVLAEREHIATLAQKSTVRRPGLDTRPMTLGETLEERLGPLGVKPEGLGWDSWRRDDGRWVVQVAYTESERSHVARYLYDPRARSVVADNDEGRWLTGESEKPPAPAPFVPRLARAADEAAGGAAAEEAPARPVAKPRRPDPTLSRRAPDVVARRAAAAAAVPARRPAVQFAEQMEVPMPVPVAAGSALEQEPAERVPAERVPVEQVAADQPAVETPVTAQPALDPPTAPVPAPAPAAEPALEQSPAPTPSAPPVPVIAEQPAARTGTEGAAPARPARSRRASVPAWDDIVFGAKRAD